MVSKTASKEMMQPKTIIIKTMGVALLLIT
jgi:hypothetical protein